ncbi:MAG: YqaE/Pmp3 family membrane protein [Methylobacterium sp.]|nr:YqaE/Pmp3 family membrane protein [Methylobacterium sp.]
MSAGHNSGTVSSRPALSTPQRRGWNKIPKKLLGREQNRPYRLSAPGRRIAPIPGATVSTFIRILLAIFLPPVAVLITTGIGVQFFLNIVLTILGIVPGMVHAIWIIMRKD